MEMFFSAIASVAWFLLYMAGVFAGFVGSFFNTVVFYTVFQMGHIVAALGVGRDNAVMLAWTLVRDIVNIFLIFGILYTGALLILGFQKGGYLRTVAYIIIAALLVNYSIFFTKFVIEISNIAAIQIYLTTVNDGSKGCVPASTGGSRNILADLWQCASGGYAGAFFEALALTSLYQESPTTESDSLTAADYKRQAAMFFGGAIFLVVLGVILLSAGLMLLVRFLYLLILMILSPFAFVAWAIPNLQKYWSMWWGKLLRESFFAPLFFLGLWVTLLFINRIRMTFPRDGLTYHQAFIGEMQGFALVFLFAVAIGLLWGSLMLARQVSASWSDERFSRVHGFLQRNKGKAFAVATGFGIGGLFGAAATLPTLTIAQRASRTFAGWSAGKLREKYTHYAAKTKEDKAKMGRLARGLHFALTRPAVHRSFLDWMDAMYKGKGDKGVAKVFAALGTMGTGVSYADVVQEQERYTMDMAKAMAEFRKTKAEEQELSDRQKEVLQTTQNVEQRRKNLEEKKAELEQKLHDPTATPADKDTAQQQLTAIKKDLSLGEINELDQDIEAKEQSLETERARFAAIERNYQALKQKESLTSAEQANLASYEAQLQQIQNQEQAIKNLKEKRDNIANLQRKWEQGLLTEPAEILKAANGFYSKLEQAIEDANRAGVGATNMAFQQDYDTLERLKRTFGATSMEVRSYIAKMAERHRTGVEQIDNVYVNATTADTNMYALSKQAIASYLIEGRRKQEAIARLRQFAEELRERRGHWWKYFGLALTEEAVEQGAKEALKKANQIAREEADPEEALRMWSQQIQRLVERGIAQPTVTTAPGPAGSP